MLVPLPAGMSGVVWMTAIPLQSRAPGIYLSPVFVNSFPRWSSADIAVLLYIGRLVGTPSLNYVVEYSVDGNTWLNAPGTGGTVATVGNTALNVGGIEDGMSVRLSTTVTGQAAERCAYRALALLFPVSRA